MSENGNFDPSVFDEFFHLHPDVMHIKKYADASWIEKATLSEVDGGYMLYSFWEEDFHMLHSPYGMWRRVYIGHDDTEFNESVLSEKYGLRCLCVADVAEMGKRPLYI